MFSYVLRRDIPATVRVEAINAMVENYLPKDRVIQAGYPIEMRYAGPREALLHAVIRQREMLRNKKPISNKFSRPEVVEVLRKYYNSL